MMASAKISGNPSSLYASGREAKAAVEQARADIAKALGAEREALIFTASGSEANNHVIKSVFFQSLIKKEPCHIISTAIEHSSIREALKQVEKFGVEVTVVGCDKTGKVSIDDVQNAIKPETRLISIQLANNEVGTLQPVGQLAQKIKGQNILLHTDAVQAFGKIPVDIKELGVDFLSIAAHKIYGPKGIGALYIKNDETLMALVSGSSHERKLRAGTESVQSILGFCKAVALLDEEVDKKPRDHLVKNIIKECPSAVIHTPIDNAIGNTLSVSFPGKDGHSLAIQLDLAGFEVSTGSACSAGSVDPSPVLEAMGVPLELNKSSIRISLGKDTTIEDLDRFVVVLKALIAN